MPHIKLEYTKNLDIKEPKILVDKIINILFEIIQIKPQNCRFKFFKLENHLSDIYTGFIHLEVRLIEGRKANKKKEAAFKCIEIIKKELINKDIDKIPISIEFRDMSKQEYFSNTL